MRNSLSYRDDYLMKYMCVSKTNMAHALPVPVHREVKFIPKGLVVFRLHDTAAGFRTGMKFSLRRNNRDELTPV